MIKKTMMTGAAGIAALLLAGCSSVTTPTVALNEYVNVSFEGYDGGGTAVTEIDYGAFAEDNEEMILEKLEDIDTSELARNEKTTVRALKKLEGEELARAFWEGNIGGGLDKHSWLSNGDTVVYEWDTDGEALKELYGISFEYEDMEFTAEGLEEPLEVDPFDGVTVVFEGMAPDAEAVIRGECADETVSRYVLYETENGTGLSNGDTVTVRATNRNGMEIAAADRKSLAASGRKLTRTEMEVTVEGLSSYITSAADIPEDTMEKMLEAVPKILEEQVGPKDTELRQREILGTEYVGNYFLTVKEGVESDKYNNRLYLVYKVTLHDKRVPESSYWIGTYDHDITETYYWFVGFSNITDEPAISAVDVTEYTVPDNEVEYKMHSDTVTAKGYGTLDEVYRDTVTANKETHNAEDNIDMQAAVIGDDEAVEEDAETAEESAPAAE